MNANCLDENGKFMVILDNPTIFSPIEEETANGTEDSH